jgi:hypothetical protein
VPALDPQPSTATVRYRTTRFYESALTLYVFCEFLSPACQIQSGSLIFGIILQYFRRFADGVRLPFRADVRNCKRNLAVMRIACLHVNFLCVAPAASSRSAIASKVSKSEQSKTRARNRYSNRMARCSISKRCSLYTFCQASLNSWRYP